MTHSEKYIIESYFKLFDTLSFVGKKELLEKLEKSIKKGSKAREKDFFKSFGAFASNKTAEEIAVEIKESRKFREKELKF